MRAFEFPLDQALHWRELEAAVQKSRLAAAVAARASAEADLESQLREANAEHAGVRAGGQSAGTYPAYRGRIQRSLISVEKQVLAARNNEAEAMLRLRDADRKARLLVRLRNRRLAEWQKEFDRETEAFASEAFLARAQARIEKHR